MAPEKKGTVPFCAKHPPGRSGKRGLSPFSLAVVSFGVTIAFVWWFVTRQDWRAVGNTFRSAAALSILYATIPVFFMYLLRTLRWQILMHRVKYLSFTQALGPTLIGFMASNVLPFRAGELVRPAIIKMRYAGSFTATLATIVVERVLDLIALVLMLLLVCLFWPHAGTQEIQRTRLIIPVLGAVIVAAVAFLVLLRYRPEGMKRLVSWPMRPLPDRVQHRVLALIDSFAIGLHFVDNARHVLLTVVYTGAIWVTAAAQMYYSARAFELRIGWVGACFALLCIALAIAAPQAPGFLGTYHAAGELSLKVLNMPQANAASFAILAHAISFLPVTIAGLIALWAMGLSLGEVRHQAQEAEQQSTEER